MSQNWFGIAGAVVLWMAVSMVGTASDTRVADAAMRGDVAAVRALLAAGADVGAAHGDGMTALHWAAHNDDHEGLDLLLRAGADVHAATRLGGITPLWLAAQNGNGRTVERLLAAGADPEAATELGITALMMAAAAGSTSAIEALAARGADLNAKEQTYGQTPLIFAAAYNHPDAIRLLIEIGAPVEEATRVRLPAGRGGGGGGRGGRGGGGAAAAQTPAQDSAEPAPAGAVPTDPPAAASAPAQPAAPAAPAAAGRRGGRGADPAGGPDAADGSGEQAQEEPRPPTQEPMGGLTPLLYAARQGHQEAAAALLRSGANVDTTAADGTTPLMMAIINGHFDLAMFLLEQGADPTKATLAGGTPLYRVIDLQWAPKSFYPQPGSVRQQHVSYLDLMRALIARGADPNARLARGLWYTGYGFDLDGLNVAGATPFWRAAQAADLEAMRLLVAAGADPNIATLEGVTPLLAAAGDGYHGNDAIIVPGGRMPAVRYLVEECDADVNAVDVRGGAATSILHTNTRAYTAVHAAAARGDNEMIRYLVSKGARVDLVGENGLTAADMANGPRERIQPFPETVALLIELGSAFNDRCVSC